MSSKTLHGNASCDLRHASADGTRAGAPLNSSAKVFSTALAHHREHRRLLQRRVSAHAKKAGRGREQGQHLRANKPNKPKLVSVVLRSRTYLALRAPSLPSLHTVAHASVTSKGHPQRMLRSNINGIKITISPPMSKLFSEELRSRASSTKQHSAGVSKPSAKQ